MNAVCKSINKMQRCSKMAESITVQLEILGGKEGAYQAMRHESPMILSSTKRFTFELMHKQTLMGDVPVHQFWMRRSSVYGTSGQRARNRPPILDFGWWQGFLTLSTMFKGFQETFILAHLYPHARHRGSQRVFADAVLTEGALRNQRERAALRQLDQYLMAEPHRRMGLAQFRTKSAKLLGPPKLKHVERQVYAKLVEPFLHEGRQALSKQGVDGLRVPIDRWKKWMATMGRHRGHSIEKRVFDIVSQEIKAALNRYYSIAWNALVNELEEGYELTEQSVMFHRFWHIEQFRETKRHGRLMHGFQGHVLALHPGAAMFLFSTEGPKIMGNWLKEPSNSHAFERVLYGLYVAMICYQNHRDDTKGLRTKRGRTLDAIN
jgi:hypothetical protein